MNKLKTKAQALLDAYEVYRDRDDIDALDNAVNDLRAELAEPKQQDRDAARYQWLKAWNKLDGWTDEAIDRQIAIDAALAEPEPQAEPAEREHLRAAQADAVMPLIGPLLDAWVGCTPEIREQQPELDKRLRVIDRAMGGAGEAQPQPKPAPEPTTKERAKEIVRRITGHPSGDSLIGLEQITEFANRVQPQAKPAPEPRKRDSYTGPYADFGKRIRIPNPSEDAPDPEPAEWQELTRAEIRALIPCGGEWKFEVGFDEATDFARSIIAAWKAKNFGGVK